MLLQFLRLLPTVSVRNACSSSINCFTLRTHNCGELRLEHVEFLLIKDAYGSVQALLPEEMKNLIKSLKEQSSLFVEGTVTDRGKDRNNKIPTGHIQTPTLSHFTPGGANEFPVPANDKGECFSLPQSPQIYKQLLMCGGIDKYYQVAICYRDELTKPNRQPEFTQLDLELSFTNQEKIISLIEQIIINSWPEELEQYKPAVPFPRMDYSKADMRIPWEITDCLLEDIENSSKIVAKMFVAKGALKSLIKERILRWKQKIGLLPYKQAPLSEHEEDLKNGINLDKIEAQHYDLVLNGEEIGGGSIRIHNAELQKYVLTKILGIDHEPLNHLLEALQYGAPPHGDSNASIRDVIAFPKSASGKCHMTGSPTKPDESLLDRYNLEIPDADEVERRNYF
uniref:tRNA-synt_2 domain-containing protein n=1 Tax=Meloidogyne hapla TaxID=6305 RepID=A0A1I8AZR5_MELHA